jgi:integrase
MIVEQPVSSLFAEYLEKCGLRPASVAYKRRACDLFIKWFGDLPVKQVAPATIEGYRAMLRKTGRKPHGRSQVSVRGYLDNFRPFWRWLRDNGHIDRDPFAGIRIKVDELPRREGFTRAEISLLLRASKPLERLQNCLGLLGCRRGEMFNIQVRDIHLDVACPYIMLAAKEASAKTWPWGTKNHQIGLVALPVIMEFDGLTVGLTAEIHQRMTDLAMDPEGYLCLPRERVDKMLEWQREGVLRWEQISDPYGNFGGRFRQLQRRAGVRRTKRFHELRAAFTTSMFDANMPVTRVAKAVRHQNIQTTMKYDRKSDMSLVADVAQIAASAYVSKC